jgi:hypothetical protein
MVRITAAGAVVRAVGRFQACWRVTNHVGLLCRVVASRVQQLAAGPAAVLTCSPHLPRCLKAGRMHCGRECHVADVTECPPLAQPSQCARRVADAPVPATKRSVGGALD